MFNFHTFTPPRDLIFTQVPHPRNGAQRDNPPESRVELAGAPKCSGKRRSSQMPANFADAFVSAPNRPNLEGVEGRSAALLGKRVPHQDVPEPRTVAVARLS